MSLRDVIDSIQGAVKGGYFTSSPFAATQNTDKRQAGLVYSFLTFLMSFNLNTACFVMYFLISV